MLISFNRYGAVERKLTHGTPARQGTSVFKITCYFNGRMITNSNKVTITIRDPNNNLAVAETEMTYVNPESQNHFVFNRTDNDDIVTTPFVNGTTYRVHEYSVTSSSVFAQYGTYTASIAVYNGTTYESGKLIDGLITIPVQRSTRAVTTITESEYDFLMNRIDAIQQGSVFSVDSISSLAQYDVGNILVIKSGNDIGNVYEVIETAGVKSANFILKFAKNEEGVITLSSENNLKLECGTNGKVVQIKCGDNEHVGSLSTFDLQADRSLSFPDKNGTIAVTDDIPTVVANPTATGTTTLSKLTVGNTTYNIPSGGGGSTYKHTLTFMVNKNDEVYKVSLVYISSNDTVISSLSDLVSAKNVYKGYSFTGSIYDDDYEEWIVTKHGTILNVFHDNDDGGNYIRVSYIKNVNGTISFVQEYIQIHSQFISEISDTYVAV